MALTRGLTDLTDGNLASMEDPGGQGSLGWSLLKDLDEMVALPAPVGAITDMETAPPHQVDQFEIKTAVRSVLVNTVEQDLTGTKLFTALVQAGSHPDHNCCLPH